MNQPTVPTATSNQKMGRDFAVATPAALVGLILAHFGITSTEIAIVTPYAIPFLMRVYRALRSMDNGLGAFIRTIDPATTSDPTGPVPAQ